MLTLRPVHRALVPVDAAAAQRLSAPNYDEFQGDREVWDLLQARPGNILKVTMPHCDAARFEEIIEDGCPAAMDRAGVNMRELIDSPLTRIADDVLFVYEVVSPRRPDVRQIGLGGMAASSEIRTEKTPDGTIIRNEGIMPEKAEGRARLITATGSDCGTVNCAVRDESGRLLKALERIAESRQPDFAATDEADNHHRVWLVSDRFEVDELAAILSEEPAAYVADGNHRSAAAAQLGKESFLAVFFPTSRLRLEPYNRLVKNVGITPVELLKRLETAFEIQSIGPAESCRPAGVHDIGLYLDGEWYCLTPKAGTYDADNGAESIDADILQRHLFDAILGLSNPRDKRINYVGGNKDSAWLKSRVDAGDYQFALSLAPVTMDQFVAVCEQNRFMPPKSTWFDPKIRSGLVVALLS